MEPMNTEALLCFVRWCRSNPRDLVLNPEVAQRVLAAYAETGAALETEGEEVGLIDAH